MIKIKPKITNDILVDREVLRILANSNGLSANEICDVFLISYDDYYTYRDLTPIIKMNMDLYDKNTLRNQAYKIASDAMDMYATLTSIKDINEQIKIETFKTRTNKKKLEGLKSTLKRLEGRKYYLESLVNYYQLNDYM